MPHLRLLDELGHAVIATDIHGLITHWNARATDLYGWTEEEVRGHNIVEVTPASMSREQAAEIMAALAAGEAWSGTFPVRDRAGKEFAVCVTDLPISGQYDEVVGIVGVSAPLTQPSALASLLERVVAAANVIWPGRAVLRVDALDEENATISDPHLIQVLSLLIDREMRAHEGAIEISATRMTPGVAADFNILEKLEGAYIHVGPPSRGAAHLRDALLRTSLFVERLIRPAGGRLAIGATASRPMGAHLFLPLRKTQLQ